MEFCKNDEIYDCIVVGVGGHGSAVVANLARSGVKVLGLEQFSPVHEKGSSHGRTRIYRQAYFEDPKYVPLLKRSLTLWHELNAYYKSSVRETVAESPDALLYMSGGVMIGPPSSVVVSGVLRSIAEHSMPHEVLSAAEMLERYPQFRLSDHEIGVYEENAGVLMAELCVASYIHMARAHGADFRFEEAMLSWDSVGSGDEDVPPQLGSGVRVRTSKGTYFGRKLVLSVGAWAPGLYGSVIPQMRLCVERRVLMWFKASEEAVEDFKKFPIYIWDLDGNAGNFYGFPSEAQCDGEVKVAFHLADGSLENALPSPDAVDRTVHPEEIELMRSTIKDRIPAMNGPLLRTSTCMYTSTADGHFVLDFHPSHSNVLLVSPCSGHGFKFISVVGEIVDQLVRTGSTEHDISLFRLDRPQQSAH